MISTSTSSSAFRETFYHWEENDVPETAPLTFRLDHDGDALLFEARVDLPPTRETQGFQRGLWEGDVVELFFQSDSSGSESPLYFEINLAAGGGCWAASFTKQREGEVALPDTIEILETSSETSAWNIRARIFNIGKDWQELTGNVCGIFGHDPRRYASHSPLAHKIDFHQPKYFRRLLPWIQPTVQLNGQHPILDIDVDPESGD